MHAIPVYVQANPHFRLPDDDVPIIMIGAGTGVAPYRAFLQEREARGAAGKSWLFFGERNFRSDFLYQTEWQGWLKDGVLEPHGRRLLARRRPPRSTCSTACSSRHATSMPGSRKARMSTSAATRKAGPGRARGPGRHRRRAAGLRRERGRGLCPRPAARPSLPARRLLRFAMTAHRNRPQPRPLAAARQARARRDAEVQQRLSARHDRRRPGRPRSPAAVPGDDNKLMKFHGIYQQDDRDIRDERRRQKLEPAYHLHGARAAAGRRLHARAVAEDRRARARPRRRDAPADHAPDLPVPLGLKKQTCVRPSRACTRCCSTPWPPAATIRAA